MMLIQMALWMEDPIKNDMGIAMVVTISMMDTIDTQKLE